MSLTELADHLGTDKGTRSHFTEHDGGCRTASLSGNHYTPVYEQLLAPLREKPIKLLELGVHFGGSLRMWEEWMPNATIIGADLDPTKCRPLKRAKCVKLDQGDPRAVAQLGFKEGPFDVVIDDGSHLLQHAYGNFFVLFPHSIKTGGLYIIEDCNHLGGHIFHFFNQLFNPLLHRGVDFVEFASSGNLTIIRRDYVDHR